MLFIKCDLTNARFVGVEFHQVGFIDCDISGLVANLDTDIDYSSLFSGCKYLLDRHPFLPLGTELPIPDILETDEPGTIRRKLSHAEAKKLGRHVLEPIFNKQDEFVGMRVVLEPGPDQWERMPDN